MAEQKTGDELLVRMSYAGRLHLMRESSPLIALCGHLVGYRALSAHAWENEHPQFKCRRCQRIAKRES